MHLRELEVVWPLHRSHYLSPALAEAGIDMETEPESSETCPRPLSWGLSPRVATWRRVRCWPVGELFSTAGQRVARGESAHAESDGRPRYRSRVTHAAVVEQARTRLADSANRGSTAEEREAAAAWLVHAVRDEQQVEPFHQRTSDVAPASGRHPNRKSTAASCEAAGSDTATHDAAQPGPPPAAFAREQLDALTRQQQRIVHRSALLAYVIAAETRSGHALTLGDALAELLADITEAARTIGTILQKGGDRRKA